MKASLTSDLIDPEVNFRDSVVRQRQGTAEIRGSGRSGPGVKPFSFFRMQGERHWSCFSGQLQGLK